MALDGAEIIVMGELLWRSLDRPHGRAASEARPNAHRHHQGLEADASGDLVILPDVLKSELPANNRERVPLAAIGGPCIAGELAGRRQTCVVFGSRDAEAVERLAAAFRTPYYHVWTTTDLAGLEYCAALKNAYTVGIALAYGRSRRPGGRMPPVPTCTTWLPRCSVRPARRWRGSWKPLGGPVLCLRTAGAGDMFVTCVGDGRSASARCWARATACPSTGDAGGSHPRGAEIIRNMGRAVPRLVAQGKLGAAELPLLRLLVDVVVHGRPAEIVPDTFFGGGGSCLTLSAGHTPPSSPGRPS